MITPILFISCNKDDDTPDNNNNNNGNNLTGTIADVVGVWQFIGHYDASGNIGNQSPSIVACLTQSTITLDSLGNGIVMDYYWNNGIGPCLSQSIVFSFNYINSTTLEFITPSSCGNPTVTLPIPTQFKIPSCNADNGSWDGGYLLYEL